MEGHEEYLTSALINAATNEEHKPLAEWLQRMAEAETVTIQPKADQGGQGLPEGLGSP